MISIDFFESELNTLKANVSGILNRSKDEEEKEYCKGLLKILNELTFGNRKSKKGWLSYYVRDQHVFSLHELSNELVKFDNFL